MWLRAPNRKMTRDEKRSGPSDPWGDFVLAVRPLWALQGALGLLCSGPTGKEWHLGGCDWPWPAGGDQAAATHVAGRKLWRTRVTTWVSSALDAAALACRGCDCQGLRGLRNEGGGQLREDLEGLWEGEDEHGCGSKIYWNNEGYTLRKRPPNHRGAASCGARVTRGGLWTRVA